VANVYEPNFDLTQHRDGFEFRAARVAQQAGAERLGASVYELEPGNGAYPYHFHLGNEELLVVLAGHPQLRTGEGWRQLDEGEVVAFPVGESGAHQLVNRSREPVRVLIISQMEAPDVVVYPDSRKVGAREHAPGSGREGLRQTFRSRDQVDYWEDEQPPEVPT
jgi:uncharacterized cupin superfamily protein